MRPPRIQHNTLRHPLDDILRTSASVRLVRVLIHDVGGPVSVTDAAKRAGLSTTGARKALETLEGLGIAVRVGTGRAQKYGPKLDNPYLSLLRQLFEMEQKQYEDLIQALQQAVAMPETRDAWIREPPDEYLRSLEIDVVAETKAISWIGSELRSRLIGTEKRFDLIIELNVFTRADSPIPPENAIVLWSSGDSVSISRRPDIQIHAESAQRSLRMANAIAELIKTDPSLVRQALHYTNRLLHEGQGTANSDIAEWRQLLETYSPERLRDLLVSQSSRAERLRRSSPFFAVLTPDERDRMIEQMETEHEV
jgi:molybdenum-dependent DNA-binding transcriptional regulator ModE